MCSANSFQHQSAHARIFVQTKWDIVENKMEKHSWKIIIILIIEGGSVVNICKYHNVDTKIDEI